MEQAHWEHFEHEADVGVRGYGPDPASAFEQAALALTAVITDPAGIAAQTRRELQCSAPDRELLFAEWLKQLINLNGYRAPVAGGMCHNTG